MLYKQIRCFLEVANCLSFTAAAKNLFMSQQAVTKQVAALEQELGFRLFHRSTRSVSLTPAGEDVFQAIESAIQEWNRICYQGFSPEERAEYDAFLTRITENVVKFKREEPNG